MEEKLLDILAEVCDDDSVKTDLDGELFDSGLLDSLAFADLLFAAGIVALTARKFNRFFCSSKRNPTGSEFVRIYHFLAFPAQMCYHYKQRCQVLE